MLLREKKRSIRRGRILTDKIYVFFPLFTRLRGQTKVDDAVAYASFPISQAREVEEEVKTHDLHTSRTSFNIKLSFLCIHTRHVYHIEIYLYVHSSCIYGVCLGTEIRKKRCIHKPTHIQTYIHVCKEGVFLCEMRRACVGGEINQSVKKREELGCPRDEEELAKR